MVRIIVCIKEVPRADQLKINPETGTLIRSGVESDINPPDLNALEIALQLKEKHGGEVIVLTMGPPFFRKSLEKAIGMGADRAILLTDRRMAGADTAATAYTLSEGIKRIGEEFGKYDLILFGEETTDSSTGHVGPGVAGHLNLPQITYVSHVELKDNKVIAKRVVEDGYEIWESTLPAVITVNFGSNIPRQPTLTGMLKAKRAGVIIEWNADYLKLDITKIGLAGSPTIVSKIDNVILPKRKNIILSGDVKESVKQLIDYLIKDGIIEVDA